MLQKTNFSKTLPRFVKKGGPSIKGLAQKILDNASASTKRKQTNAKSSKEDSTSKGVPGDSPSEIAGSKRAREGENTAHPATKKMVVTSNLKDASKSAQGSNGPTKAGLNGKVATSAAPRPRPAVAAPKLSSLFGTLSSASKRPGTTNAERAAAAAAAAKSTYVLSCFFQTHASHYLISTSTLHIPSQSVCAKILTILTDQARKRRTSQQLPLLNQHSL